MLLVFVSNKCMFKSNSPISKLNSFTTIFKIFTVQHWSYYRSTMKLLQLC